MSQRQRDALTLVLAALLAAAWYGYTSLSRPDTRTTIALIATPFALIVLRRPIDWCLAPFQPVLELMPPALRHAIGLLLPFIMARNIYEAIGGAGGAEYQYFTRTTVIGTLASYAWLRQPEQEEA